MDLDAEKVVCRACRCDFRRRPAHAEADLQHARRFAAERGVPVERLRRVGHDKARSEFIQRAPLSCGYPSRTRDKATNPPMTKRAGRFAVFGIGAFVGLVLVGGGIVDHRKRTRILGLSGAWLQNARQTWRCCKSKSRLRRRLFVNKNWSGRWESNPRL